MKTLSRIFGAALVALTLSACGNSAAPALSANGFGNLNNQWGNQTGVMQGGCAPLQNGSIPFSVQGATVNGAFILGGVMPMNSLYPGTYGQAIIGGGGFNGGQGMIQYAPFQSSAGTMQITVSGGTGQGMVSGMINLNQTTLYQILGLAANMGVYQQYPQQQYPNQYPTNMSFNNVCVSSIAVHIVHQVMSNGYTGMGQIYRAQVYLYLNNSQTPIGPVNFF